mmetsp:Transcript_15345/g.42066  ORF Transcript_15345/g.42066 Transcript_15345/m.42066 type:complete len:225 (-) Transcript_15345:2-676(-)
MVLGPTMLVSKAAKVRFFHDGPLDVHDHELLLSSIVHYLQLEGVGHHVFLSRLLVVVVDPELDAPLIPRLEAKTEQRFLAGEHVSNLCGAREVHQEEGMLRDAELSFELSPDLIDRFADVYLLRLPIALWQNHEVDGTQACDRCFLVDDRGLLRGLRRHRFRRRRARIGRSSVAHRTEASASLPSRFPSRPGHGRHAPTSPRPNWRGDDRNAAGNWAGARVRRP